MTNWQLILILLSAVLTISGASWLNTHQMDRRLEEMNKLLEKVNKRCETLQTELRELEKRLAGRAQAVDDRQPANQTLPLSEAAAASEIRLTIHFQRLLWISRRILPASRAQPGRRTVTMVFSSFCPAFACLRKSFSFALLDK